MADSWTAGTGSHSAAQVASQSSPVSSQLNNISRQNPLSQLQSRDVLKSLQQSLDDRSGGLLGNLSKLAMRASSSQPDSACLIIPAEARARYDRIFDENSDGKPYLTGIEAAAIFLQSGHKRSVLSRIWEQSDTDRNGHFSRQEFTQALWLIDLEKSQQYLGQSPPSYSINAPLGVPPTNNPQYNSIPSPQPGPSGQHQNLPGLYNAMYLPPNSLRATEMREPMICPQCDEGLIPGDVVYRCEQCPGAGITVCEPCHLRGQRCQHEVPRSRLEAAAELKRGDVKGDFWESVKCDGCKVKLKDGMLCWHCKRCFDPNYCKDCWKQARKRCKHAKKGKVQLRRMGKSSSSDTGEVLEIVGEALFG